MRVYNYEEGQIKSADVKIIGTDEDLYTICYSTWMITLASKCRVKKAHKLLEDETTRRNFIKYYVMLRKPILEIVYHDRFIIDFDVYIESPHPSILTKVERGREYLIHSSYYYFTNVIGKYLPGSMYQRKDLLMEEFTINGVECLMLSNKGTKEDLQSILYNVCLYSDGGNLMEFLRDRILIKYIPIKSDSKDVVKNGTVFTTIYTHKLKPKKVKITIPRIINIDDTPLNKLYETLDTYTIERAVSLYLDYNNPLNQMPREYISYVLQTRDITEEYKKDLITLLDSDIPKDDVEDFYIARMACIMFPLDRDCWLKYLKHDTV